MSFPLARIAGSRRQKMMPRSLLLVTASVSTLSASGQLSADTKATATGNQLPDRIKGALAGALVADALCLGSHYEYDAKVIKAAYGNQAIDRYLGPGERMGGSTHGVGWGRRNYHPGQRAGDQTDYGEYNRLVLEYLASREESLGDPKLPLNTPVDLEQRFIPMWRERLESNKWGAWRCTQTKQTLQQVASGTPTANLGGMSNAMAVRSAGIFGAFDDEDKAAEAARKVSFTHRNEEALVGSEFFTRVTHKVH
eukprot:g1728.t1